MVIAPGLACLPEISPAFGGVGLGCLRTIGRGEVARSLLAIITTVSISTLRGNG